MADKTKKEQLDEELEEMLDLITKYGKWTCNEHEKCITCVYFYSSCHGLSNSSDLERQAIPKNEKRFIEMVWTKSGSNRDYLFWLRFRDIGVEFENLHQVRALEVEDIKKLLKEHLE